MKKMKLLAMLLAMSMMLSLTACGGSEEPAEETTVEEPAEEEAAVEEEATVEEEPEEPAEEETAEEAAAEFSRGVITDNVYTSEFAGLTFTAPEGFRFYDDSEMATIYGVSEDMLGIESADTVVYDMYCIDVNGTNISINYENLSGIYGSILDEQTYLELSQSGLKTAFESMEGVTINNIGISTVDIGGTAMNCINVELDMQGTLFYETIVVKKVDGYMAICTASAYSTDDVATLLAGIANI